jgi:hypothetical protein
MIQLQKDVLCARLLLICLIWKVVNVLDAGMDIYIVLRSINV